jgi:hypothetical protein
MAAVEEEARAQARTVGDLLADAVRKYLQDRSWHKIIVSATPKVSPRLTCIGPSLNRDLNRAGSAAPYLGHKRLRFGAQHAAQDPSFSYNI